MENVLKYSVLAIVGLFAIAVVVQLFTGFAYPGYYGYSGMMGGYGGMTGFGMLGGVLFLIIFIVIIFVLLEKTGIKARNSDALDILKKRYAAGEITKEEFLEKKKDLD